MSFTGIGLQGKAISVLKMAKTSEIMQKSKDNSVQTE